MFTVKFLRFLRDAKPKLVFSPKNSPNVTTRESLWDVISDGKTVATYKFSQLRIALVCNDFT